jgi:hypothetical protein
MLRRRDWILFATFCITIVLAYIPYLQLGHGMVLGFFSTYASEQTPNESMVPLAVHYVSALFGLAKTPTLLIGYAADLIIVGAVSLLLWRLRRSERISMELGILTLTGAVFAVASHIYPWYTTELLPWVALLIGPVWLRKKGLSVQGLAIVMVWYCALASMTQYYFVNVADWRSYYLVVYATVLAGLASAACVLLWRFYDARRKHKMVT